MSANNSKRGRVSRLLLKIGSVNLNALSLLALRGFGSAKEYVKYTNRLYGGYGLPWNWSSLPWRNDLTIPRASAAELFPEIDFTRSPDLLHPFPRDLSVHPHELMILCHVVRKFQPERTFEFGTAEGRTTLNLALHAPENGEVITLNFPPEPGASVGYFYWDSPLKSKIKQLYEDVGKWNPNGYRSSAGIVFCDACDQQPGMVHEMAQGFAVIKPGGILFRHDYGSNEGPTKFWNEVGKRLPVRHIEGTTLLCMRVDTPDLYAEMQKVATDFLKKYA